MTGPTANEVQAFLVEPTVTMHRADSGKPVACQREGDRVEHAVYDMGFDVASADRSWGQEQQRIDDMDEVIKDDLPRFVGLPAAVLFEDDEVRVDASQCDIIWRKPPVEADHKRNDTVRGQGDKRFDVAEIIGERLIDEGRDASLNKEPDELAVCLRGRVDEGGVERCGGKRICSAGVPMPDTKRAADLVEDARIARRQVNVEISSRRQNRKICFASDVTQPDEKHAHIYSPVRHDHRVCRAAIASRLRSPQPIVGDDRDRNWGKDVAVRSKNASPPIVSLAARCSDVTGRGRIRVTRIDAGGCSKPKGGPSMIRLPVRTSAIARLLAASAPLFVCATPAVAQDQAPTGQAVGDPAGEQGVGDIVVTATRRRESAKDVPLAVTAISGEKLDVLNSSGLDIRFLAGRTPSLQVESSFGRTFPRFYIRGLGNTDFDPNAAQPVSVVYDDVALENPMLKSFPVFDLQSVEVLRGPQGTLFGRNTPAGVVKINSAKPDPDKVSGYATGSWATYNTINGEAALNLPIGNGFAFRASGIIQSRDDWVTNDSATGNADRKLEGYRDVAGRFQLGYTNGDFNALLNVHVRDLTGSPRIFRAGLFKPGTNDFNTGFDPKHVTLDGYTSQSLTQWGTNLRLDYHLDGIGTFYSVTGYEQAKVESTGDVDGGNSYPFTGGTIGAIGVGLFPSNTGGLTKPKEFSQELRYASEDMNGIRLQGGLYYFYQTLRYHQYDYAFGGTGSRATDLTQDIFHDNRNENYGAFASIEAKPTELLTLRAGVRYSHDYRNDLVTAPILGTGISDTLPARAVVRGSNVTWDASATYELTPAINVYSRLATGYQGPAIQDRVTFGSVQSTAPKQTTFSGESGFKGTLLDRKVNFSLDAYWYSTKDLQITAVGGSSNSARLISADKAIGYGVEGEFEARPVPELSLTASGSYNFTEIRDRSIGVGVCATCTVLDPIVNGFAMIDGNDLPQAPRWIANWTARYGIPLANGGEVYAYTDWVYRSRINFFLYEAVEFTGKSSLEGGLKVGYKSPQGYEVGAFVRNITNQYRSISAIDFNNLTGMINEPRIIGGQFKVEF